MLFIRWDNIYIVCRVVLGRRPGPLSPKKYKGIWTEEENIDPSEIWNDAITDIAVIRPGSKLFNLSFLAIIVSEIVHWFGIIFLGRGEIIPEDWEVIRSDSGDQECGNCNLGDSSREVIHIAVQRRRNTKKRSHISKVWNCSYGKSQICI